MELNVKQDEDDNQKLIVTARLTLTEEGDPKPVVLEGKIPVVKGQLLMHGNMQHACDAAASLLVQRLLAQWRLAMVASVAEGLAQTLPRVLGIAGSGVVVGVDIPSGTDGLEP